MRERGDIDGMDLDVSDRLDMGDSLDEHPLASDPIVDATAAPGGWDFVLMAITLVLLAALGAQSIAGTAYAWWAERTIASWEQTGYGAYVALMNAVAAPLVVGLVVVIGLCVPKRLLSRRALLVVSLALLLVGVVAGFAFGSVTAGLAAYLVCASLLQLAVVVLTLADARSLRYVTEGRLVKVGSGLLHMGFLLFALVVVALQDSAWMLPVFYTSALFIMGGTVLSFYAGAFVRRPAAAESTQTETDASDAANGGDGPD